MSIFDAMRRLFGGGTGEDGNGSEPPSPGAAGGPGGGEGGEMISCEEALTFIHEFLDGELEGVTRTKVKAHFDVCGRCYPHLRLEEAYRTALRRAASGRSAPPELRSQVLELLAEASEE